MDERSLRWGRTPDYHRHCWGGAHFSAPAVPLGGEEDLNRQYFMEKRGDGVPIIMNESMENSGRLPEYHLIDDTELLLTIHAANSLNSEDDES